MGDSNADLVRENFARFARGEGEAVYATWADDAVWHILDASRYRGDYTRDEYFALLAGNWATDVTDYRFEVEVCESFGEELVVAYLKSSGVSVDGPIDENGGLMIYRVVNGKVAEGWALSRGKDAKTGF